MYRKALTLQELDDIINDPNFMDADKVDVIVIPPEPDSLTDEDEAIEDMLGLVNVNDVPGELIVHYKSLKSSENSEIHEFEDIDEAGPSNAQDKIIAIHNSKKKEDIFLMTHFSGEKHHQFIQNLALKDQKLR